MENKSKTKSLRISPPVHKAMKIHAATKEENIIAFADRAIINQIKADKSEKKHKD